MNMENCWVKKAEAITWDAIKEKYPKLFPSKTGITAKDYEKSATDRAGAYK